MGNDFGDESFFINDTGECFCRDEGGNHVDSEIMLESVPISLGFRGINFTSKDCMQRTVVPVGRTPCARA